MIAMCPSLGPRLPSVPRRLVRHSSLSPMLRFSLPRLLARMAAPLLVAALALPASLSAQTSDEDNAQVTLRILAPLEAYALPLEFRKVVAGVTKTVLTTSNGESEGYAGMVYITGNPDLPIRVQFADMPTELTRDGDPAAPANERMALSAWTARLERVTTSGNPACGSPGNVTPAILTVLNVTLTDGEPHAQLCVGATVSPPANMRSGMYYAGDGWGANPAAPPAITILISYDI